MIQDYWRSAPGWIKNKYAITLAAFFIWLVFFDQNDLWNQYKLKRELRNLEQDKAYYQEQIELTRNDLENLLNDNEKLERYAREKYLMKKNNEEIFVIVKEDE